MYVCTVSVEESLGGSTLFVNEIAMSIPVNWRSSEGWIFRFLLRTLKLNYPRQAVVTCFWLSQSWCLQLIRQLVRNRWMVDCRNHGSCRRSHVDDRESHRRG